MTADKTIIAIKRQIYTSESTIGKLYYDNEYLCYTLEDTVRKEKINNKTAIPSGEYEIVVNYSKKYKKLLPLLLNVPNYTGVRIHSGNTADDTRGCILVGKNKNDNVIYDSRLALSELMEKIESDMKTRKIYVDIS